MPPILSRVMIHHAAVETEHPRSFLGTSSALLDSVPAPPSLVGVRSRDRQGRRLRHLPFDNTGHHAGRRTTQHLRLLITSCGRFPTRPRVVVPSNSSTSLSASKWSSASACHPSQRNRQHLVMPSSGPRGRLSPVRPCGLCLSVESKLPPDLPRPRTCSWCRSDPPPHARRKPAHLFYPRLFQHILASSKTTSSQQTCRSPAQRACLLPFTYSYHTSAGPIYPGEPSP